MKRLTRERIYRLWRTHLRPIAVVILVLCAFRSAVADWNDVPTGSMTPTILAGDRIFVNKAAYDLRVPFTNWRVARWGDPQRGDIVIFFSPADGQRLVKRIIGLPGDRVQMRDNRLLINGKAAIYDRVRSPPVTVSERFESASQTIQWAGGNARWGSFGPVTVAPGHYLVLGDNRDRSSDSRRFGLVSRDRIVGRATRVMLSIDPQRGYRPRWKRFGRALR